MGESLPAARRTLPGSCCVLHIVLLQGAVSWFRNGVLRVLAGACNITSSYPTIRPQPGRYFFRMPNPLSSVSVCIPDSFILPLLTILRWLSIAYVVFNSH